MALDCDDGIHVLPSGASYSSLTLIQFPLITRSLILKDEHPGLVGKIISIALEYQPNNVPGPKRAASESNLPWGLQRCVSAGVLVDERSPGHPVALSVTSLRALFSDHPPREALHAHPTSHSTPSTRHPPTQLTAHNVK